MHEAFEAMTNLKLIVGGKAKANPEPQPLSDEDLDDALGRAQERLGIHRDVIEFIEQGLEVARKTVPPSRRDSFLRTLDFIASTEFSLDIEAVDCAHLCVGWLAREFTKANGHR
jgi:hypothetical protein